MFICEVHVSSVAKKLLLKKYYNEWKVIQIVSRPLMWVGQKKFAFKQQMIILRLYHYSKSNQVSQCQGQDWKMGTSLGGGGG